MSESAKEETIKLPPSFPEAREQVERHLTALGLGDQEKYCYLYGLLDSLIQAVQTEARAQLHIAETLIESYVIAGDTAIAELREKDQQIASLTQARDQVQQAQINTAILADKRLKEVEAERDQVQKELLSARALLPADPRTSVTSEPLPNYDDPSMWAKGANPVEQDLIGCFDAATWAREFMRVDKAHHVHESEATMLGWFANAIMAGYDHARRQTPEYQAMMARVLGSDTEATNDHSPATHRSEAPEE